jgi:hypothetical protein
MVKFPIKVKVNNFGDKPIFIVKDIQTLLDLSSFGLIHFLRGDIRREAEEIYLATSDRYELAMDKDGCFTSNLDKVSSYCIEEAKDIVGRMFDEDEGIREGYLAALNRKLKERFNGQTDGTGSGEEVPGSEEGGSKTMDEDGTS